MRLDPFNLPPTRTVTVVAVIAVSVLAACIVAIAAIAGIFGPETVRVWAEAIYRDLLY